MLKMISAATVVAVLLAHQTMLVEGQSTRPMAMLEQSYDESCNGRTGGFGECAAGERVIRHAINVGTVAKNSVASHFPGCTSSLHPLIEKYLQDVANDKENNGNSAREIIEQVRKNLPLPGWTRDDQSNCVPLSVTIPRHSTLTRIELSISTNNQPSQCARFTQDLFGKMGTRNTCSQTHAGFFQPAIATDRKSVAVIFANWSDDLVRTGTLSAYYR